MITLVITEITYDYTRNKKRDDFKCNNNVCCDYKKVKLNRLHRSYTELFLLILFQNHKDIITIEK